MARVSPVWGPAATAGRPVSADDGEKVGGTACPTPPPSRKNHRLPPQHYAHWSLQILQLIKNAQDQHGLRHGDYTRYRRYCTNRLMRLYKSLGFKHGRGKYVKRQIGEHNLTDVRYLHVVLYMAERAWSYAMEIKDSAKNSRQQSHLIRRLAKAAKWADLLSRLCMEKADSRTAFEAFAYAQQMRGNLLIERENDWETAFKNFMSASSVYSKLGKIGDIESQVRCRQRVEELNAVINYCSYNLGSSDMKGSDILDLSTQEGPAIDLLQSKFESVMAEAMHQQAISMTELEWLGRKWPLNNEKIRICILKGQELEKEINNTESVPSQAEKKLSLFDKTFLAYQDAKRHVREDLIVAGSTADVREQLVGLDRALSSILLQHTVERNQMLVILAKSRLERQQIGLREEKGEKPAKPEDLVRLHDTLIQNIADLSDLVTSGRNMNSNETSFANKLASQRLAFRATRCFYLAQSYGGAAKYTEAYALLQIALEHCVSALEGYKSLQLEEAAVQDLLIVAKNCKIHKCLSHASGVAEASKFDSTVEKGIAALNISKDFSSKEEAGFLLDKIDTFVSAMYMVGSMESPRISQIPPSFQAVPCRPIVLDTAHTSIHFPSLDMRVIKADQKMSLFGKWWKS